MASFHALCSSLGFMVFSPDQAFYGLNKSVGGDRRLPYISSFMGILIDLPCNLEVGLTQKIDFDTSSFFKECAGLNCLITKNFP